MFVQNGWDKTFRSVLTPVVKERYITDEGDVTVYEAVTEPEPGHWLEHGDVVYVMIKEILDDLTSSSY